ncbi:hypothetical protein YC2023_032429 [Brassica napus]
MGNVEEYKPVMAMILLQLCYAGVTLSARVTLVNGTSPRVFILYRQVFATIFIFPFLYFSRYETVNIRNVRGLAKISGTVLCVVGAISMTLLRGPKILNSESTLPLENSLLGDLADQNMWLIGCLCVFASTVPVSAYYPDHLSLSAWMCLFGTIQCAVVTFFFDKDPNAWIIHSYSELATCLYAGVVSSALAFTVQAWVISKRGPLFSAMFNPLCTVIVTILASLILKEEMFTGSLIGGICVIMGLYIVLWGKAEDVMINQEQRDITNNSDVKIQIEDSSNTYPVKRKIMDDVVDRSYGHKSKPTSLREFSSDTTRRRNQIRNYALNLPSQSVPSSSPNPTPTTHNFHILLAARVESLLNESPLSSRIF